jgi:uncharacterized protein
MDINDVAAILTVTVAGFFRGVTGFGGSLMMTPMLSILIGPIPAVVTALVLETAAALVMFPDALPRANWRILSYLTIPAALTVPLGGYFLLTIDPALARKCIAIVVICFCILLLFGWRYRGSPRPGTSVVLGAIVGVLLGATSVGAPPVILYLLAGPDPIAITRASLTFYLAGISLAALVMLWGRDVLDQHSAWLALVLTPVYFVGLYAGVRLFSRFNDARFRQFTLILLIAVSVGILLA